MLTAQEVYIFEINFPNKFARFYLYLQSTAQGSISDQVVGVVHEEMNPELVMDVLGDKYSDGRMNLFILDELGRKRIKLEFLRGGMGMWRMDGENYTFDWRRD